MGAHVSYTSFDHTTTDIVPVIASFDAQGHVSPLYVRINRIPYRIETYYVVTRYSNVTEFRCKIADSGFLRPLELTFYGNEQMWTVPACHGGSTAGGP